MLDPLFAYKQGVVTGKTGNGMIREALKNKAPFMYARFGSTEMKTFNRWEFNEPYTHEDRLHASVCTGIVPPDDIYLPAFCGVFAKFLKCADIMGVWHLEHEEHIMSKYCPQAQLACYSSVEAFYHEEPWTKSLAGQKVLVVHPFQESIAYQYKNNREKLFKNPDMLPEFELLTLKAIETHGTNYFDQKEKLNWIEALKYMCEQVEKLDFDVAITGCGAYGLPIAGFCKLLGKKSVHMAGSTQLLFGIKGKRWDESYSKDYYNEFWKRPFDSEKPNNHGAIEEGCYW